MTAPDGIICCKIGLGCTYGRDDFGDGTTGIAIVRRTSVPVLNVLASNPAFALPGLTRTRIARRAKRGSGKYPRIKCWREGREICRNNFSMKARRQVHSSCDVWRRNLLPAMRQLVDQARYCSVNAVVTTMSGIVNYLAATL
jgi:hypothetical protein